MKESTAGIIACHIELKIDAAELKTWEPSRIKAFFDGMAKIIEAKEGKCGEAGGQT